MRYRPVDHRRLPATGTDHDIRLITPPLFIATKLEAFYGRGDGRFGDSHDLEDVVSLLDGRPEVVDENQDTAADVRTYLMNEFDDLLGQPAFVDALHWHLPWDAVSQARVPELIARLRRIAGLQDREAGLTPPREAPVNSRPRPLSR